MRAQKDAVEKILCCICLRWFFTDEVHHSFSDKELVQAALKVNE